MPTRRCCCYCYKFRDIFDRVEIGPDWEECSGTWSINTGKLTNSELNSVIVLKHMAGNPVGILTANLVAEEGRIYQVYVFRGTEEEPCNAANTYIVEFEFLTDSEVEVRIVGSNPLKTAVIQTQGVPEFEVTVCVSLDYLLVDTEAGIPTDIDGYGTSLECEINPDGYWFALGNGAAGTVEWTDVRYSDHYDNDKTCPKCLGSQCFPGSDEVIIGYDIEINGVQNADCDCSPMLAAVVSALEDTNFCVGTYPSETGQGLSGVSGVPPNCGDVHSVSWALNCTQSGQISLTIDWSMSGGVGQNSSTFIFNTPIDPRDVQVIDGPTQNQDDGAVCDFQNATITAIPIIGTGCCGSPLPVQQSVLKVAMPQDRLARLRETKRRAALRASMTRSFAHYKRTGEGLGDTALRLLHAAKRNNRLGIANTIQLILKTYACNSQKAARAMNADEGRLLAQPAGQKPSR